MKKKNEKYEDLQSVKVSKIEKKEKHKKSRFWEIVRFVIVGVLATIVDAGVFFVLMKFVFNGLAGQGGDNGWGGYVAWGISTTISFFVSCLFNFFLSRLWVYQNVDKKVNTKTAKAFWTYVGLGAIGWLIGLGIQEGGVFLCNTFWPELKLSINFVKVSWSDLWNEAGLAFWAFVIIYVIKTLIVLVYNYLTRKLIIFKAPKDDELAFAKPAASEGLVVTATTEPAEQPKKKKKAEEQPAPKTNITTASSFKEIFHEEVTNTFGEEQKKAYVNDAVKIVREEIEAYDREHGRSKKN